MSTRRLKKGKKWIVVKFAFFLYVFVGVFALVWLRTEVTNLEYGVNHLQKERGGVMRERKLLSAGRASAFSMKNIEKTAMDDLGMDLPERENVFFVKRMPAAGPYGVSVKSGLEAIRPQSRVSEVQENLPR